MEKIQTFLLNILDRLPHFDAQAVLVALIAGWITGAIWYMLADGAYRAATKGMDGETRAPRTQIRAAIAQAIMTIMLAMIIDKLSAGTLRDGIYIAIMMWFGFVMTTMIVNHAHLGAPLTLTIVDGIHWLLVLIVMGAIIGTMTPNKQDVAKEPAPVTQEAPSTIPSTSGDTNTSPDPY